MGLLKTPAIVLKSRKWGEADRIVTFYTRRFGKIRGVARGARRMKSRFGSALEPFVHCDLNLFEKPHDALYRVTHADLRETFPKLRENLTLMSGAARLVNLVTAVTADGDACGRLYETLRAALEALESADDPLLTTLAFEIKLLGLTGFKPQTDHCASCGTGFAEPGHEKSRQFSPAAGGLVCPSCAGRRPDRCLPLSAGSLALLQQALRWAPAVVSRLRATGQVRAELEAAVEAYVMVVAGRQLPPVDFLASTRLSTGRGPVAPSAAKGDEGPALSAAEGPVLSAAEGPPPAYGAATSSASPL
jgi:DNA repair protein RecO (recombination protein O)